MVIVCLSFVSSYIQPNVSEKPSPRPFDTFVTPTFGSKEFKLEFKGMVQIIMGQKNVLASKLSDPASTRGASKS